MDLKPFEGHTPGPWKLDEDDMTVCAPLNKKQELIACVYDTGNDCGNDIDDPFVTCEIAANGQLLAAAPDLLAENIALTEKCRKLAEIHHEYEKLLEDELGKFAGIAFTHGYRSEEWAIEIGKDLRAKITEIETESTHG